MAVFGTIADSSDGVIEISSTGDIIENTTTVHLEDSLVSFYGDGNWSFSNGSLKLGNGVWSNVVDVSNKNLTIGLSGLAGAIFTLVWVVRLELLWLTFEVFHTVVLPTSIATIGSTIAINKLLLGEAEELIGGNEVSTFNGSGG